MNILGRSLLALFLLAGCDSHAMPPPTSSSSPGSAMATPPVDARGFFTQATTFAGPALGGRGGSYSITLQPDGAAVYTLADAKLSGTYAISHSTLRFIPSNGDPAMELHGDAAWSALQENQMKRVSP